MLALEKQRLLVIAPHPDDEVIGCAGLIQKINELGGEVFVLFLTVGNTKDFSKTGISTGDERKEEIKNVASMLSYKDYDIAFEGDEFHLQLDVLGQKKLMDKIERDSRVSIENVKPTIIAFPSIASYNQDHKIASLAAQASLRPANKTLKHFVSLVLTYEEVADNWSMTKDPKTNFHLELTAQMLDKKIEALKLYKSQYRDNPSTRSEDSIRALARLRGAGSATEFAESYFIQRLTT